MKTNLKAVRNFGEYRTGRRAAGIAVFVWMGRTLNHWEVIQDYGIWTNRVPFKK